MPASPLPDIRATLFRPERLHRNPQVTVHGVILDVPLAGGLDTLAAYVDGTARYINHSGRTIIWEVPASKNTFRPLIDNFLAAASAIPQAGTPKGWDPPSIDGASSLVTVLTRTGLVTMTLGSDPTSARLLTSGAVLMKALISAVPAP